MELAAAGDNMMALREIAKAHIAKCKEGDLQAIRDLADRLAVEIKARIVLTDICPHTFCLAHMQRRDLNRKLTLRHPRVPRRHARTNIVEHKPYPKPHRR